MGKVLLGEKPLTETERNRRYRQRKRGLIPDEREMTDKQKLARLREENRMLRAELRRLEEQASDFARHDMYQTSRIKHLETMLAKKESMP